MLVSETSAAAGIESHAPRREPVVAWKEIVDPVEPFLKAVHRGLADQVRAFDEEIAAYATYALGVQGKQLRPALVALSASATGGVQATHIHVAVIIEMVHLATLVHDDVMDEAEIRRSRPTVAAKWGNETAVLLGDCLFAHALKLAAGFPTTEICRAVAAAANTVCAGEILQNKRRNQFSHSREDYFKVLQMKTGELFALSCDMGAYLNGAEEDQRKALRDYGMAMGTAYQIFDDCLDLFGSEVTVGKSLGTDLAKGKLTLPLLLLLERLSSSERERLQGELSQWNVASFPELRARLEGHGVLEQSRSMVGEHLQAAARMIDTLAVSEGRTGLKRLVGYLDQQMMRLGSARG